MMQMVHSRFNALLSACVLSLIATVAWSQSLTWLGTLGGNGSRAYGVSANGSVVVGAALNAVGQWRAFRWQNGAMQDLGMLGGNQSEAYAVSADGSVVAGMVHAASDYVYSFRWQNGFMDLIVGLSSRAHGVSANGTVVVGVYAQNAFRWSSGNFQTLGSLPGGTWSYAYGVSADGAVVVGSARNATGQYRAFRWTASGGMQDLGTLPGGTWSEAYGVSANGSVVVGWALNAAGQWRAFRWTASGGMRDLGTLGGGYSYAYAVSADGTVVVGQSDGRAFRWTASGVMEDLNTTYASLLTNGSVLWEARAISPDGRYIVGKGRNAATNREEAFLLDTQGNTLCTLDGDVNGDGRVDDADLLILLFNFGNQCP
jgi:probable HAF family extracellular repeat protein